MKKIKIKIGFYTTNIITNWSYLISECYIKWTGGPNAAHVFETPDLEEGNLMRFSYCNNFHMSFQIIMRAIKLRK
jgi:hypothetical protein